MALILTPTYLFKKDRRETRQENAVGAAGLDGEEPSMGFPSALYQATQTPLLCKVKPKVPKPRVWIYAFSFFTISSSAPPL